MLQQWYAGVLFVVLAIVVGILGIRIARRHVSIERLKRHNEVAAPIHATLGVIYAVLLAFVVVTVWEQYSDAETAVANEAGAISALYRDAEAFDAADKLRMRAALKDYLSSVLSTEWDLMREGALDNYRNPAYDELWNAAIHVNLANERDRVLYQVIFQRMNQLDDSRSIRRDAAEYQVPSVMWVLLIIGGFVTVLFACYFGAEDLFLHTMMVSSLAATIAFILYMIAAIDRPFVGIVGVDTEPYSHILRQLSGT
jgi:hypothetical protein